MANNICTGVDSGTFRNSFSLQYLWIKYTFDTPIETQLGQDLDLASLIPLTEMLTINFQSRDKGTADIMSRIPLRVLAVMEGVQAASLAFCEGSTADLTGTVSGAACTIAAADVVQAISSIEFRVPIFEGTARIFGDGDLLETIVDCADGTVDIWGVDNPYSNRVAPVIKYRTQTILANNTQSIGFRGVIFIPNDDTTFDKLQLVANTSVQYQLIDLYAQLSDEWVSNKSTYQTSPYLGIDVSGYRDVKLTASGTDCPYYYIQTEMM